MFTLNESQTWAVIGIFASTLLGMAGFLVSSLNRTIRASISVLDGKIDSLRQEMGVRFESLSGTIDHLDCDVQFLMKRELEDRA